MSHTPEQILEMIGKLDLSEKIKLLTGQAAFTLYDEPKIGLPAINISDGPTGVRGLKFSGGEKALLFPSATVWASTWDEAAIRKAGEAVADEAERQEIATVLGPTINLHRTPLGGRLFEQYSEDPYLTGKLAAAYTESVQSKGIGACLKHFIANESETERNTVNSVVDQKTLSEIYFMPFQIAIEDANPWWIMASYNSVNGEMATQNSRILRHVLRNGWGWDGVVVSDWYATRSTADSANGGLDLVMPGPIGPWGEELVKAVEAGEVEETIIDEKLIHILTWADRAGMLGQERQWRKDVPSPDSAERGEHMTELAAQGSVLLKNEGNILPLASGKKIAAIGRPIVDTIVMGAGSSTVNAAYVHSIADGLTARREAFSDLAIIDGVEVRERGVPAVPGFVTDPETGEAGIRVKLYDIDGALIEDKHVNESYLTIGMDEGGATNVTRIEITADLAESGDLELGARGSGHWEITAGDYSEAFVQKLTGHDPGEASLMPPSHQAVVNVPAGTTLKAVCDISAGDYAPSQAGDSTSDQFNAAGGGTKGLIARVAPRPVDDVIADAVEAAKNADIAIVGVGLTEEGEAEAVDKKTLKLPGEQDLLVEAVAEAAEHTIVIVNAATPVLMPWEDKVDAVLVIGLPGQNGGDAVADVLLGDREPAGRLVTTWPIADGATPAWSVTPDENGDLVYAEGVFVGYRGHAPYGLAPTPAHWFGEGLGYGDVTYESATVTSKDPLAVDVSLSNTAKRATRETVQVYFRPADVTEPVRLVGFAGAEIPAGGSATVTVDCDPRMLQRWDVDKHGWLPLGDGTLLVARGLGDVKAELEV